MRKQVLITKGTAVDPQTFYIPPNCSIVVDGNLATNTIPVYHVGINGTDLTVATVNGEAFVFSSTNTSFSNFTPTHLKFDKGITTNAVGLLLIIM
jgi:hypothetical protein